MSVSATLRKVAVTERDPEKARWYREEADRWARVEAGGAYDASRVLRPAEVPVPPAVVWCSVCERRVVEESPRWMVACAALIMHALAVPMECPYCKAPNSLTTQMPT